MPQLISHEEVQEKMKKIPEWEFNQTSISRVFEFNEYQSGHEISKENLRDVIKWLNKN